MLEPHIAGAACVMSCISAIRVRQSARWTGSLTPSMKAKTLASFFLVFSAATSRSGGQVGHQNAWCWRRFTHETQRRAAALPKGTGQRYGSRLEKRGCESARSGLSGSAAHHAVRRRIPACRPSTSAYAVPCESHKKSSIAAVLSRSLHMYALYRVEYMHIEGIHIEGNRTLQTIPNSTTR